MSLHDISLPASVETVHGGGPPYGVKESLVVNGKRYISQCGRRYYQRSYIIMDALSY